jgi:hypothetical protein
MQASKANASDPPPDYSALISIVYATDLLWGVM